MRALVITKEELKQWLAESKLVDEGSEFDENGDCQEWRIYERDERLYQLDFVNGRPCEKWDKNGFVRGVYELRQVIRETELVEVTSYRESN